MAQSNPFKRAHMMMAAIAAIMSATAGNIAAQQAQISALAPYESRGKGKGGHQHARHGAQMANIRAARKARNIKRHRAAVRG